MHRPGIVTLSNNDQFIAIPRSEIRVVDLSGQGSLTIRTTWGEILFSLVAGEGDEVDAVLASRLAEYAVIKLFEDLAQGSGDVTWEAFFFVNMSPDNLKLRIVRNGRLLGMVGQDLVETDEVIDEDRMDVIGTLKTVKRSELQGI